MYRYIDLHVIVLSGRYASMCMYVLCRDGTIKPPSCPTLPDLMFNLPARPYRRRLSFSLCFSVPFSLPLPLLHSFPLRLSSFSVISSYLVGIPIRPSPRACTWLHPLPPTLLSSQDPCSTSCHHPRLVSLFPAEITFSFSWHCIFNSLDGTASMSWYFSSHPSI